MNLSPKAQQALARVVEQFKRGDLSPVVEIARLRRKGGPVPFDGWSFSNRIMAYIQTGSTDLRGYRQWQRVGRQVQKGSRAAFILAPRVKKEQDGETDEETAKVIGFLAVPVFPFHTTEGEPLPEHDYTPRKLPPLVDVAERWGVTVTWQPLPPDRLGDCDGKRIHVGTHDPAVFFHELAHAAHTRVDGPKKKRGQDPYRETIAEFTASVLMHLYGLGDRTGNVWQYVQHYHKDPLAAIQKALSKVEQVLALLLEEEVEQCTPTA